jgi:hypothetical protein
VPPTATPTPAITDWRGAYFGNASLIGDPLLVRNDTAIDFNWEYGAPAPGIPADGFSARWTRVLNFEGGLYRFYASMDDGLRLLIDGEPIIDVWQDGFLRDVVVEHRLGVGQHAIEVAYYDAQGVAEVHLWWEKIDAYPDWRGAYWDNQDLNGNPALVRNDPEIDFDWGDGSAADGLPEDDFSARWTRRVSFESGTYRFHVWVDDGARLWVDDVPVIDAWYDHSLHELVADHALTQGEHMVRLEYYESAHEAQVRMWWERTGDYVYPDWKGEYWANQDLAGDPVLIRSDDEISFRWEDGSPDPSLPADYFSIRWSRLLRVRPGLYRFYGRADDGIRLYVNDRLVLDEWHSSLDTVYEAVVRLDGENELRVEYYERTGDARAYLWWRQVDILPY